jgi:hypothetical protein
MSCDDVVEATIVALFDIPGLGGSVGNYGIL